MLPPSTEIVFMAPTLMEKQRWSNAIQRDYEAYGAGRRKDNCPAALIAPIRRRHMSLQRTRSAKVVDRMHQQTVLYVVSPPPLSMGSFGFDRPASSPVSAHDRWCFGIPPIQTSSDATRRKEEPFRTIGTLRLHIMEGSSKMHMPRPTLSSRVSFLPLARPSTRLTRCPGPDPSAAEGLAPHLDKKLLNPYCVVTVDSGQRVVTSTKAATASPFFGEEFFFDSAITDRTSRVTVFINTQLDARSRIRDARLGPFARLGDKGVTRMCAHVRWRWGVGGHASRLGRDRPEQHPSRPAHRPVV